MSRESDAIRAVPLADIARRLGMVPSGGRWKPCPECGKDRVAVGERVISCFACGLRLDAVSAARRDGRTWEQAAEWAGVYSVPGGYRVPPAPMRLDWSPVWTWDTRRNPPRFESSPLPWDGPGDAPFEPDPHAAMWARFRRDEWPHEVDPSIRARAAADGFRRRFPGPSECVEYCAALHGAAAVLGWDVVGEVWG
jgi:hypothetical protein